MKRAFVAALICFVAVHRGSMQTRNAADGPWSGWVQCELSAQLNEQGGSYSNQQTHTWMLTAATPTSGTDIKDYPATWTVAGGGTSQRPEGNGRTRADKWNTAGQPMPTTISFRVDLTGTLFIALRGAQLRSAGAMTGMSVAHSIIGNTPDQQTAMLPLTVEEFRFPVIRDDGTKTSITGSTGPTTVGAIASGQPPRTVSIADCSWNLVRGGGSPPPPPSGRSITREQVSSLSPVSRLDLPGATAAAGPSPTTTTAIPAPLATATAGPTQTTNVGSITGGRADAELGRTNLPTVPIFATAPASATAGPAPTGEQAVSTAPLNRPGPVATVQTLTFAPPTGSRLSAFLTTSTDSRQITLDLHGAWIDFVGRIFPETLATGISLPPGRYGASLSLECAPIFGPIHVQLVASNRSGTVQAIKTWDQPAQNQPSFAAVSFAETFNLTYDTSSLQWKIQGRCFFSGLVITKES